MIYLSQGSAHVTDADAKAEHTTNSASLNDILSLACESLRNHGFINYYGLQVLSIYPHAYYSYTLKSATYHCVCMLKASAQRG
jgi:hypothetical protein